MNRASCRFEYQHANARKNQAHFHTHKIKSFIMKVKPKNSKVFENGIGGPARPLSYCPINEGQGLEDQSRPPKQELRKLLLCTGTSE
ncbi:hypothetical protein NDU88_010380 [Pleurodeles waltl]|uniref:Uncharacterized protein n=1 Tax=Pleurodeles waltl TaxID=8319 RepID=A0AAV7Q206_PLEWA|nr:hypothetical protein NDU88_010380 [Pleurodeles waltl]